MSTIVVTLTILSLVLAACSGGFQILGDDGRLGLNVDLSPDQGEESPGENHGLNTEALLVWATLGILLAVASAVAFGVSQTRGNRLQ